MTHRFHAVYELGGESLQSAERLLRLLIKVDPANWPNSDRVLQVLQDKTPDIVQALGLSERAIQIRGFLNGLPRAYSDSPACYRSPSQNGKYYLYCPIDYQGNHFAPKDATLLTEADADKIGYGLWGGGWTDPITVFPGKQSGTAMPADFDPAKHHVFKWRHLGDDPAKPYNFFKAAGETLRLLQDRERAQEQYSKAVDHLFRAVDGLKEKLLQDGAIPDAATVNDFYLNYSLNHPQLEISARRDGTGEPLTLADNRWFISAFKTPTSQYFVANPNTDEGRSLQAFFDAIPADPHNTGFPPALLSSDNVDGPRGQRNKPIIRNFPEGIYLAYRTPAYDRGTFVPPGAEPVSQAEFLWLDADHGDREIGIALPAKPLPASPLPKPQP